MSFEGELGRVLYLKYEVETRMKTCLTQKLSECKLLDDNPLSFDVGRMNIQFNNVEQNTSQNLEEVESFPIKMSSLGYTTPDDNYIKAETINSSIVNLSRCFVVNYAQKKSSFPNKLTIIIDCDHTVWHDVKKVFLIDWYFQNLVHAEIMGFRLNIDRKIVNFRFSLI